MAGDATLTLEEEDSGGTGPGSRSKARENWIREICSGYALYEQTLHPKPEGSPSFANHHTAIMSEYEADLDTAVPTRRRSPARFRPTQPVADRISRALRHRLRLLHRSHANFFVLGATGNVYNVNLSVIPTCTCPDRTVPCKHILFVFLRVLSVSVDDACLRRKTLRPCQLARLLDTPTSPGSLAGQRVRERFHQVFTESGRVRPGVVESRSGEGSTCPVCLEEMREEEKMVSCGVCRNALHEECFMKWKRTGVRRVTSCVMCRARWREKRELDKYVNLAAYISDEDGDWGGGGGGTCID
ncbi:hypothetical protein H6P81_009121 [Aristolochia fimbriata]|uniref:Mitogen-activated protein kinase kinase kinase 1 n=1 Tax=Aristolochia fimbriata TaxID=158543 RepID=A0AAV7EMP1_ARIFI|nr:hypothetical protein H6P81_009121 [Aristolochia fimbriata]